MYVKRQLRHSYTLPSPLEQERRKLIGSPQDGQLSCVAMNDGIPIRGGFGAFHT
jgi:hypothetical protein